MSVDELAERVAVAIYQYQLAADGPPPGPDPELGRLAVDVTIRALLDEPKLLIPYADEHPSI